MQLQTKLAVQGVTEMVLVAHSQLACAANEGDRHEGRAGTWINTFILKDLPRITPVF